VQWHGVRLNQPDWGWESHTVAATVPLLGPERLVVHLIVNAYWEPLDFALPALDPGQPAWRPCIDTSPHPPDDISGWIEAPFVPGTTYRAASRSLVLLLGQATVLPDPL